jgi:hypothetical protein
MHFSFTLYTLLTIDQLVSLRRRLKVLENLQIGSDFRIINGYIRALRRGRQLRFVEALPRLIPVE